MMSTAFYIPIILFFVVVDFSTSTSTTYYIASTANACATTNGACQTLSQYATTSSDNASDVTLILLGGRHSLSKNWYIYNMDHLIVYSNSSTAAVVDCGGNWRMQMSSTQNINISNVLFIGCKITATSSIESLTISNSQFIGHSIIPRTVLELNNVAQIEIHTCVFTSNRADSTIGRYLPPYYKTLGTVGGAIFATRSNMSIIHSRFENNSAGYGGAIFTQWQSTTIINSTFINNTVKADSVYLYGSGSAVYDYQGVIDIFESTFQSNKATGFRGSGGALYFYDNTAIIRRCSFIKNFASYGGVQRGLMSTIYYDQSTFAYNRATRWGGVMDNQRGSNITIRSCMFQKNFVLLNEGGVVRTWLDSMTIINSSFLHNTAILSSGGALSGLDSNFTIVSCRFIGNSASYRGGALYTIGPMTKLQIFDSLHFTDNREKYNPGTTFINNFADHGGAVYSTARSLKIDGLVFASKNSARDRYVFYLALTTGQVSGTFTFSNNHGSLVLLSSNIVFDASSEFINSTSGAISILQSTVYLNGSSYRLEHNQRENGGAVYATESKLAVNAPISIVNNRALVNGGGVYLYQSEIVCGQNCHLIIQRNEATKRGGGIHAISSLIMLNPPQLSAQRRWIEFTENTAEEGGGMLMESNAKLYIVQFSGDFYREHNKSNYSIYFESNRASTGGALYVDDYTNSVGACNSSSHSPTSECFFQLLSRHLSFGSQLYTTHIGFLDNDASKVGPVLHGGLLDRCTTSPFAEILHKYGENPPISGVTYFEDISSINRHNRHLLSSGPVQVCPCVNGQTRCSYTPTIRVKRGQTFSLSLTVLNQVGDPVNATVSGYLRSAQSVLIEGQLNFISNVCEKVSLQALSPHDSEQLTLYASDGPCRDALQSSTKVNIEFIPCNLCPIGFQPAEISCDCYCHDDIKDYVNCNATTELLVREFNIWIAYINESGVDGFLVYENCPFGYCYESGVSVNLNQPQGEDAQCRFNRTGLLCGSCIPGLSLSLGSSRCLSCPNYWPAIFILITLAAIIAGIMLVIVLLALRLTVAIGTLNGLIFYANIVAIDKSILLPFTEPNFITVIISWLNLELGIDTCYIPGMDNYAKAWLQLVFPAYVILLVILVITISNYSRRFSRLIGNSPVETLATLIILSYTKFIQTVITALSYGTLVYPDGSEYIVWLPDANVHYFSFKHACLFFAAIFILVVGLLFTILLFTWQWLPSCPNLKICKVMNDPKFRTFIEMYMVPYEPKHRYWTGLLLLVRIVLYLIAAVNGLGGPSVILASITIAVGCIVILKSFIGSVYTKWEADFFETTSYFNILFLTLFTWLALDTAINQRAIAYISVICAFTLLLLIVAHHLYAHTQLFSKLRKHKHCMTLISLLKITHRAERPHTPDPVHDDRNNRIDIFLETIEDSVDNTHSTRSESRGNTFTVSVVEMPNTTSTRVESDGLESDNFADISVKKDFK